MKKVNLKKWDNCYTYVLKRKGVFLQNIEIDSDEFVNNKQLVEIKKEKLAQGDIIVKFTSSDEIIAEFHIKKNGFIYNSTKHFQNLHFIIIENDKFCSDVFRSNGVPTIHMHKIEDIDIENYWLLK